MFKNKRIIALILAFFCVVNLFGCSLSAELDRAAKGLTKYIINAEYDENEQSITAHQKVDFVNSYDVPLSFAAFHLYPNAFREGSSYYPVSAKNEKNAFINGKSYGRIEISNLTVDGKAIPAQIVGEDQNILKADFADSLYPSAKFRIEFDFKLYLPNLNHRLGYTQNTVNLGNWYPIAAVYQDGEYDTTPYYLNGDPFFSSVANYEVNLTTPAGFTMACSGEQTTEQKDGKTLFKTTAKAMRDYAIVLSREFSLISQKVGATTINYYYYSDDAPQNSLTAAVDSITTFNDLFGDYPYATFAVVETPFVHGGMEYPALVMIASRYSGDAYHEIIIHETAHQYWYGAVGNNQITEAWLDEGLAEFSVAMFYEQNPQYNTTMQDSVGEAMRDYILYIDIFKQIKGELDTRMNRPSNQYEEYEYVCMIYVKGQLMFDSLYKLVGEKAFKSALRLYYKENKFKIATKDHLIGAFEKTSKKQLAAYFDSWIDGKVQIYGNA